MKRAHRRWHRRIGSLLVPVLAVILGMLIVTRDVPQNDKALPSALPGGGVSGEAR